MTAYKVNPIKIVNDIPVFSANDFYIENYIKISADHLAHLEKTGHNPFMDEQHWVEIEKSTEILINKYSRDSCKILDVGVGLGRLLERFPSLDRYGVDISLSYLRHAKNKGIEVCMAKIEDLPYSDNFFDFIVCTDVLEHVLDLNASIEKILATLKPGGFMVIRVPYREDLSGYLSDEYPYDLVHLRSFDESELRILFSKIFKVNFLEFTFAGYMGGRLKFGNSFRLYSFLVRRTISLINKINKKLSHLLAKKFCIPVEINIVINKPLCAV
jgi:SAM-dependent methyltransferase